MKVFLRAGKTPRFKTHVPEKLRNSENLKNEGTKLKTKVAVKGGNSFSSPVLPGGDEKNSRQ